MDRDDFPQFPYKGHNWAAHVVPADRSLNGSPSVGKRTKQGKVLFDRKPELIITANNELNARRAFDLILATHDLVNASVYQSGPAAYSGGACLVDEAKVNEILSASDDRCHRPWASFPDIPWACLIAAKASR
jgi:hypothetical protein